MFREIGSELEYLKTRIRDDRAFAAHTVASAGANLRSWIPALTASEIGEALEAARRCLEPPKDVSASHGSVTDVSVSVAKASADAPPALPAAQHAATTPPPSPSGRQRPMPGSRTAPVPRNTADLEALLEGFDKARQGEVAKKRWTRLLIGLSSLPAVSALVLADSGTLGTALMVTLWLSVMGVTLMGTGWDSTPYTMDERAHPLQTRFKQLVYGFIGIGLLALSFVGLAELWGLAVATPADKLTRAAERGRLDEIRNRVEQGMSIDATNTFGRTALMTAAENGQTSVAAWLVRRGADPNRKDAAGKTAAMLASAHGHKGTERMLQILESDGGVDASLLPDLPPDSLSAGTWLIDFIVTPINVSDGSTRGACETLTYCRLLQAPNKFLAFAAAVPDWELKNSRIRILGFLDPSNERKNIRETLLASSRKPHCFLGPFGSSSEASKLIESANLENSVCKLELKALELSRTYP